MFVTRMIGQEEWIFTVYKDNNFSTFIQLWKLKMLQYLIGELKFCLKMISNFTIFLKIFFSSSCLFSRPSFGPNWLYASYRWKLRYRLPRIYSVYWRLVMVLWILYFSVNMCLSYYQSAGVGTTVTCPSGEVYDSDTSACAAWVLNGKCCLVNIQVFLNQT